MAVAILNNVLSELPLEYTNIASNTSNNAKIGIPKKLQSLINHFENDDFLSKRRHDEY